MKTQEDSMLSQETADAQAVIAHALTGTALDPEIASRIRAHSERATEALRQRHGTVSLAVDLIREVRDLE